MGEEYNDDAVLVSNLSYHYQMSPYYSIEDVSMNVPRGAKLLLIGANGAGKTTLLHVLGGKYMVHKEKVRVLEAPPFHETTLASSGDLAFLGTTWRRANGSAVAGDVTARKMLYNVEGTDHESDVCLLMMMMMMMMVMIMMRSKNERAIFIVTIMKRCCSLSLSLSLFQMYEGDSVSRQEKKSEGLSQ